MEFITVHTYCTTGQQSPQQQVDEELLIPINQIKRIKSTCQTPKFFSEEEQKRFNIGTCGSIIVTRDENDYRSTKPIIEVIESFRTIAEMINSGNENLVLGLE